MILFRLLIVIFLISLSGEIVWAAKPGILLAAFGTSVKEAYKAYDKIEAAYANKFPDSPVMLVFTSQKIRKKLAREGRDAPSIAEALQDMADKGCQTIYIQSLHVMAGEEYGELERAVLLDMAKHPGRFKAVYLGRPLLESLEDAQKAGDAILSALNPGRAPDEAVILMGHGHGHGRADLVLEGAAAILKRRDPLVFIASVEGSRNLEDIIKELQSSNVKKVWLMPLMVVAGDHARNDLLGDEPASWANRLRTAGYEVEGKLMGLGEIEGIREIFLEHTNTLDDLTREPVKP